MTTVDSHVQNFRMPAEWEHQSAVWLSWPHNIETWPENLQAAQDEFVELVVAIAESQNVYVMASGEALQSAQSRLESVSTVTLVDIETNDAWARDYAPTFVVSAQDKLIALDWHYNAWGGKYPPFDADQKVAEQVAKFLTIKCVKPAFCFEGGAIEVNGEGVLLCTKSCALDPNRNPGMSLVEVEKILTDHLGVSKIAWLSGDAIEGDDTDGHIDQLARFTNAETIVYAWTDNPDDPQLPGLKQNVDDLKSELARLGLNHFRLIPLPIPGPIEYCDRRVPASYCNFLITNEIVAVPQFGVPEDKKAMEILGPLFPDRKLVPLASKNLSVGLGSFHCLSQHQPAIN